MVLHNDKWKKKATRKYHSKHATSLNTDLQVSNTEKIDDSSEYKYDDSSELPSNNWRYEEITFSDEEPCIDYTRMPAKAFTLAEPDVILCQDELPKERLGKGKLIYEKPENVVHLRRQVENETTLRDIKKKYNSRVKTRMIKGLCLDVEKSEYNVEDIDDFLRKTDLLEKQTNNHVSQENSIQMNITIENKQELEDFLDRLLD